MLKHHPKCQRRIGVELAHGQALLVLRLRFSFICFRFSWHDDYERPCDSGIDYLQQKLAPNTYQVVGAKRRWRGQFSYRGSRRESAGAQLFSLIWPHSLMNTTQYILWRWMHAGIFLPLMAIGSWERISPAGHTFFLIAITIVWVVWFYLWRSNSCERGKQQKIRNLDREPEPTKRNPPAELPPLRK